MERRNNTLFRRRHGRHEQALFGCEVARQATLARQSTRFMAALPRRIQLKREAGWRMPPDTVKADRSTRWGNPLRIRPGYAAAQAVEDFSRWVEGGSVQWPLRARSQPPLLEAIRLHLGGNNLACWCGPNESCHAEVLLRLANLRVAAFPSG